MQLRKLARIASKIRTPLSLAGLVLVILYAIYRQVLALDVFENIGAESTFILLQNVLDGLFWLALIAIVLGVASYLFTFILNRMGLPLRSSVKSIDARLDSEDSPYEEISNPDRRVVRRKSDPSEPLVAIENIEAPSYDFPTVDFKFQNSGSATAFLWQFSIIATQVKVDLTPVLRFESEIEDAELVITVTNNGWGHAYGFEAQVEDETLNQLFSQADRQFKGAIGSGQTVTLFRFTPDAIDPNDLEKLKESFVTFEDPINLINPEPQVGIKLEPRLTWTCKDENDNDHKDVIDVIPENIFGTGYLAFSSEGFTFGGVISATVNYIQMPSEVTYVVMIDPSDGEQERNYPISRKIPPGDVERFHIMIGATVSCQMTIKFTFSVDESTIVESETFEFVIWRPRDSKLNRKYVDGAHIDRHLADLNQKAKSGTLTSREHHRLRELQQLKDRYPFTA